MRHARLFKDGVTQPAAAHLHSHCNWISSSRMRQWGCVLSTEDYTVWTNWWSLTTAFTYLIGSFFPRLVFGSVGKAWCLQLVTATLTLYKITFQGVRHSLTLLITSILICSQERVIVIKKGTKTSTSLFYDPDLREHKAKQQNLMFNVSAQVVSFFPITWAAHKVQLCMTNM